MKSLFILSFFAFFVVPTQHAAASLDAFFEPVPGDVNLQLLMNLGSDKDNDKYYLHAMIDKNGLPVGMYKEDDKANTGQSDPRSKSIFWLRDLESEEGAVLLNRQSRDVLILKGTLDRESFEGKFVLKYLTNGLSMSYESCNVLVKKDKQGLFIQNAYTGERVKDVFVETSWLGVRKVRGLCP